MKLLYRVLILSVVMSDNAQSEMLDWKPGGAKISITPTEPMYLAGFANREVPAEATAMDLHAKSLMNEGGYEAIRAMIYWSNPLHLSAFADSIEENIISKVHEMLKP